MRLTIQTKVQAHWSKVQKGFNEDLFLELNPPFPKVKLKRFDGSEKGDLVSMELNFLLWKDTWTSEITFDQTSNTGFEFIDEGTQLPFPFKAWKHHHIIKETQGETYIIDDIRFDTNLLVLNVLLYPLLYLQFYYRKPIYRKLFK